MLNDKDLVNNKNEKKEMAKILMQICTKIFWQKSSN